ncbi:hypothetical protein M2284_001518 [Rhodococcus sp. LBL1]|nr:hypothetical protein [Prescottella agglutinans]MDH6677320.1 hypothetical protein [Rhodococcus sp. LBL1]MDH6682386.1 hypothetical protein [Rhodococcus sp. LBL2]
MADIDETDSSADRERQAASLFELSRIVGEDLLAFMLAVAPSDDICGDVLGDEAKMAVAECIWVAATNRVDEQSDGEGYYIWRPALPAVTLVNLFCTYDPELKTSLATSYHLRAGGRRPDVDPDSATSLDECLQVIACDCFAARLVGDGRQDHSWGVTRAHPLMNVVRERLHEDSEPITQLHRSATAATDESERQWSDSFPYSRQMEVHWSTGGGGSLDLRDVGDSLISNVVLDTDLDDQVLPRVADAVQDNLTRARDLATGKLVNVKTLVGIGNVTLADDVGAIDLAGVGKLRRPTVLDSRTNSFADSPTAILELERSLRYNEARLSPMPRIGSGSDDLQQFIADNERRQKFVPAMLESAEALQEDIRRVRFAMVMSSPESAIMAPTWLFNREYNPLTNCGSNSHNPSGWNFGVAADHVTVDAATAAEIAAWTSKMNHLPDSLKIGRRRLLQATTERADAIDRFIDAVVAWESMFGAAQDSALRVTGSMALILQPTDVEARRALHKTLNTYYKSRSDLVHGAVGHDKETKEFKVANMPTYASQATRYAIDSFKHILDNPDLIPLDSTARSKRILLGI